MSAPAEKAVNTPLTLRRGRGVACDTWKVDAIGIAVVGALSILAYVVAASPLLERHAKVQTQRSDLHAAQQKTADVKHKLEDLQAQLVLAQRDLATAPLKLQPATLLNQRLALLTDLVSQNGAAVDDVQPGKVITGARFDTLTMKVSGTATYCTFSALLHRLHEQFPDIGISALEVGGNPQDALGSAKFSVDLVWYTQAANGPPAAPEKGSAKAAK
jgi:Tfp pilus assembly protein PilO